ncbi:MAG: hypothetical protein IPK62_13320 [Bacteroidetes bacterium]|nr:hypothetical protein [Bacteroidota bacterium]
MKNKLAICIVLSWRKYCTLSMRIQWTFFTFCHDAKSNKKIKAVGICLKNIFVRLKKNNSRDAQTDFFSAPHFIIFLRQIPKAVGHPCEDFLKYTIGYRALEIFLKPADKNIWIWDYSRGAQTDFFLRLTSLFPARRGIQAGFTANT